MVVVVVLSRSDVCAWREVGKQNANGGGYSGMGHPSPVLAAAGAVAGDRLNFFVSPYQVPRDAPAPLLLATYLCGAAS